MSLTDHEREQSKPWVQRQTGAAGLATRWRVVAASSERRPNRLTNGGRVRAGMDHYDGHAQPIHRPPGPTPRAMYQGKPEGARIGSGASP